MACDEFRARTIFFFDARTFESIAEMNCSEL
jgi:hypothetical protein